MFLSTFIRTIIKRYLPNACVLCGYQIQPGPRLCDGCLRDLPVMPKHCYQCGLFLSNDAYLNLKCASCLIEPPPFNRLCALFPYEAPIKQLISELKFHHQLLYAQLFSDLFAERIKQTWYLDSPLPTCIIPIPLHPTRLRERGYNQTLEIAKPLAKSLNIPIATTVLVRHKPTKAQSGLSKLQRAKNIAHAFTVPRQIKFTSVVLLDDVMTTGSTIRECCKILKKHGVAHIDIWCCARRG